MAKKAVPAITSRSSQGKKLLRHIPNEIDCLLLIAVDRLQGCWDNARGDADGSISHFCNYAVFDASRVGNVTAALP